MLVPDEVRKCIVFILYQDKNYQLQYTGTGFFIVIKQENIKFVYVITAKHVIKGIDQRSVNATIYLRINTLNGGYQLVDTELSDWIEHPTDSSVDTMILPFVPPSDVFDYLPIPEQMIATESVIRDNSIGAGDEVFLTGLFANAYGEKKNMPIVRMGNIALIPDEKIYFNNLGFSDVYLIESRSIGGLSGSPVFVHLGGPRILPGKRMILSKSRFFFLGQIHGHWEIDTKTGYIQENEFVNMGISIVVPAVKIMEIIYQPNLQKERDKAKKELKERQLSTASDTSGHLYSNSITKEEFEETLKKISRPLKPKDYEKKET